MTVKSVVVILILACFMASSQGFPRVLVSPETTTADVGDTLLLPCVVSDISSYESANPPHITTLTWKRGNQVLQNSPRISIHETVDTYTSSSNESRAIVIKSVLEVCGVEWEDRGVYSCVASTSHELEQDTATFQLQVLTAPAAVLVASTDEDLNTSTTVFLSCVGFGLPIPEVTWMRNGYPVSNATSSTVIHNDVIVRGGRRFVRSTLILCNVIGELIGEYTCDARNEMTSSQFTFTVTAPTPATILSSPESNTLKHGKSANYSCDFLGYPWPIVVWTRDTANTPITTQGRFSIYTFQVNQDGYRVTRSVLEIRTAVENIEGTFKCSASNEENVQPTFEIFTVDVIIPPQIVVAPTRLINLVAMPTRQQTMVVTCVAFGSPRPTLQWRNSGITLRNSAQVTIRETVKTHGGIEVVHSQLELCGAERRPETEYSCTATNTAASNSSLFHICTIDEIELMVAPSDQTADKGGDIFLPCVALSQYTDGSTTITWRRRIQESEEGENEFEELKNTTKRVSIFHTEEQQGSGYVLIRSILHLGCLDDGDVGMYSCHVANAATVTKMANFIIDVQVPPTDIGLGDSQSVELLNHSGYIGSLTTNVLLLIVVAIYLAFRKLRTSNIGVPLINLCSSLVALNFSYIISLVSAYNHGMERSGCGFLAALFHYLLLVGSFAFAMMVTFVLTKRTPWSRKKKIIFYISVFVANWGLPAIIAAISAASNVSNYSSGLMTFCGPKNWSLYLGLVFPVIVVQLVTVIMLLLLPFLSEKVHQYVKQREVLGVGVTLFLFDVMWAVGLSSFAVAPESSTQMTLQNIFIIASAIHGLVIVFFFCVLSKKVREELIKLVSRRSTKSQAKSSATDATRAEEGMGLPECNFTNLESSTESETVFLPIHRRMSTGSQGCPPSPGIESVQNYYVSIKTSTLEPILEHQK